MFQIKERKSFIVELNKCKKLNDELFVLTNDINKKFSQVWLQGTILEANQSKDYIILDDFTGIAKIESCQRMPNIWKQLKAGLYVMVIGYFMEQNLKINKEIVLKTIKIQVLNENPYIELCWPLEVIDANVKQKKADY